MLRCSQARKYMKVPMYLDIKNNILQEANKYTQVSTYNHI